MVFLREMGNLITVILLPTMDKFQLSFLKGVSLVEVEIQSYNIMGKDTYACPVKAI